MPTETITTRCAIAGGGPAGMMLGFLLARAGVDVVVLEKHEDFLRDFRGDTIHPSTLQVMYELGLLEAFLKLPHSEVREIGGVIGDDPITFADFSHLPTHCKFIALMPQWDFLDFLADNAKRYPSFRLLLRADVDGLVEAKTSPASRPRRQTDRSRFVPTLSLVPTVATRSCAILPG